MNSEQENRMKKYESFQNATILAEEMVDKFEDGMGEIESFTKESAIETFIQHHNRLLNFFTQEIKSHKVTDDTQSVLYQDAQEERAYAIYRMKLASQGNYSPAISFYKHQGKQAMENAHGDPYYLIRGTAFLRIAQALPQNSTL